MWPRSVLSLVSSGLSRVPYFLDNQHGDTPACYWPSFFFFYITCLHHSRRNKRVKEATGSRLSATAILLSSVMFTFSFRTDDGAAQWTTEASSAQTSAVLPVVGPTRGRGATSHFGPCQNAVSASTLTRVNRARAQNPSRPTWTGPVWTRPERWAISWWTDQLVNQSSHYVAGIGKKKRLTGLSVSCHH